MMKIGDAKALPSLKHLAENAGNQLYEKYSLRAEALDAIAAINQGLDGVTPNGGGTSGR
jgi:hypothetical protein